jgi:hypothetical protein
MYLKKDTLKLKSDDIIGKLKKIFWMYQFIDFANLELATSGAYNSLSNINFNSSSLLIDYFDQFFLIVFYYKFSKKIKKKYFHII